MTETIVVLTAHLADSGRRQLTEEKVERVEQEEVPLRDNRLAIDGMIERRTPVPRREEGEGDSEAAPASAEEPADP